MSLLPNAPWPGAAAIGAIPGLAVTAVVVAFYGSLTACAFRPRRRRARGEPRQQDVDAWETEE